MLIGHGVSSFMLRQMEFDADRYEARVTGSTMFAPMMERVESLGIASRLAFGDLDTAWREKRLCDDLPSLIHSRVPDIPKEIKAHRRSEKRREDRLVRHPPRARRPQPSVTPRERRRRVHAGGPGDRRSSVISATSAAGRPSRSTTRRSAGQVKQEHLVQTDSLVEDRGKKKQSYDALRRYFQDLVHPVRAVFPAATINPAIDADARR